MLRNVTLNQYAAEKRLLLFAELSRGNAPSEGSFSVDLLREARVKGNAPQMGSTRYSPEAIVFEFIYPDRLSASTIFSVSVQSPQRIVYLPVPSWIIQSIWQGEIHGSFHFESDALELLEKYEAALEREANLQHFGEDAATGAGTS